MENKKVNINLSTLIFFGIVITLIIVGLIGYILAITNEGTKENDIIENSEKDDESINITEESDNNILNQEIDNEIIEYEEWNAEKLKENIFYPFDEEKFVGSKYVQFENNLFSVYEASLGTLKLDSIKSLIDQNKEIKHKKILFDLNKDYTNEEIIIEALDDGYSFKERGKEFFKSGVDSYIDVYVVDLNEKDEKIEIVINENNTYTIFVKSDVQMRATLKDFTGFMMTDKNGVICSFDETTCNISPAIFLEHYITENGLLTLKKLNLEDYKNKLFYTKPYTGIYFTTDLDGMKAQEYDTIPKDIDFKYNEKYVKSLNESTKFYITGIIKSDGNSKYDLKVKLLDGTVGYIYHKDGYLNSYKY